jgi:hypothetical protein
MNFDEEESSKEEGRQTPQACAPAVRLEQSEHGRKEGQKGMGGGEIKEVRQ